MPLSVMSCAPCAGALLHGSLEIIRLNQRGLWPEPRESGIRSRNMSLVATGGRKKRAFREELVRPELL